jgi:hypothetical protein
VDWFATPIQETVTGYVHSAETTPLISRAMEVYHFEATPQGEGFAHRWSSWRVHRPINLGKVAKLLRQVVLPDMRRALSEGNARTTARQLAMHGRAIFIDLLHMVSSI